MNINCRTNETCTQQRVDAVCIGDCCCTVPKLENTTGQLPPSIAQPFRDVPVTNKTNFAQTLENSSMIIMTSIFLAFFILNKI